VGEDWLVMVATEADGLEGSNRPSHRVTNSLTWRPPSAVALAASDAQNVKLANHAADHVFSSHLSYRLRRKGRECRHP
jgi:hypothetical protein